MTAENLSQANIAALLLAAGGSRRLGQPKQLVDLNGKSLLELGITKLQAVTSDVFVVTGAYHEKISPIVGAYPVCELHHRDWLAGLGASISYGVKHLPAQCAGVLIVTCDQYRVSHKDLSRLLAMRANFPDKMIAAKFEGVAGVPCFFPRRWFKHLQALTGDTGAKPILKRYPQEVVTIDMPTAATDLDTQVHLQMLKMITEGSFS